MIKRAQSIFPSLKEVVLLKQSKHVPNLKNFKIIESQSSINNNSSIKNRNNRNFNSIEFSEPSMIMFNNIELEVYKAYNNNH
jgi:hypothetical protein